MFDIRLYVTQFLNWLTSLPLPRIGLNILDYIIVFVFAFYAYEGYVLGLVLASLDLLSFILSFLIALKGYALVGDIISQTFSIPRGFANAAGFFLLALVSELILSFVFRKLLVFIPKEKIPQSVRNVFARINNIGGIIPGLISAVIILSFLFTLVISLPTSPLLKNTISESQIGSRLVTQTASIEKSLNDVFGGALYETLNFLTVEPQSGESVALNFTVVDPIVDRTSEEQMLTLVNREREKAGVGPLVMSDELSVLARDYSADMFQRGYFSHYNPEGLSPFDRMNAYGIEYLAAGENLALAPSVDLAMQGLMNSPGHRENILSAEFNHIGIGVMDGGIYGKMFTQEFTD